MSKFFNKFRCYVMTESIDITTIEKAMEQKPVVSLGKTDYKNHGFMPIYDDFMLIASGDQNAYFLGAFQISWRDVPSSAVKEYVANACKDYYQMNGKMPNRKERNDFKDEALFSLMPRAFIKHKLIPVVFNEDKIFICSTSASDCELLISTIREAFGSFPCLPFSTDCKPDVSMTNLALIENKYRDEDRCYEFFGNISLESIDKQKLSTTQNSSAESIATAVDFINDVGGLVVKADIQDNNVGVRYSIDKKYNLRKVQYVELDESEVGEEEDVFGPFKVSRTQLLMAGNKMKKALKSFEVVCDAYGNQKESVES